MITSPRMTLKNGVAKVTNKPLLCAFNGKVWICSPHWQTLMLRLDINLNLESPKVLEILYKLYPHTKPKLS